MLVVLGLPVVVAFGLVFSMFVALLFVYFHLRCVVVFLSVFGYCFVLLCFVCFFNVSFLYDALGLSPVVDCSVSSNMLYESLLYCLNEALSVFWPNSKPKGANFVIFQILHFLSFFTHLGRSF